MTLPIFPVNVPGSSQALVTRSCGYRGFSLRETSGGASALVRLWDSTSAATGAILDEIALAPEETARELVKPGTVALTQSEARQLVRVLDDTEQHGRRGPRNRTVW
jgi:hypothetical protein